MREKKIEEREFDSSLITSSSRCRRSSRRTFHGLLPVEVVLSATPPTTRSPPRLCGARASEMCSHCRSDDFCFPDSKFQYYRSCIWNCFLSPLPSFSDLASCLQTSAIFRVSEIRKSKARMFLIKQYWNSGIRGVLFQQWDDDQMSFIILWINNIYRFIHCSTFFLQRRPTATPELSLSTLSISSVCNGIVYYVNDRPYRKLNVIGTGGSSQVCILHSLIFSRFCGLQLQLPTQLFFPLVGFRIQTLGIRNERNLMNVETLLCLLLLLQ